MPNQTLPIIQMIQGIFPFSDLDQKTLEEIAPFIEKGSFPAGVQIYSQTEEASDLYFILAGEVEITIENKKGTHLLALLKTGDHFGEDSLTDFHRCQTNAVSKSRLVLIKIKRDNLKKVYMISPILLRLFTLFRKTYLLQCKLNFSWHQPKETIYLISRRHPIILWGRILPLFLATFGGFYGLLNASFNLKFGSVLWLVCAFLVLAAGCMICVWVVLEWSNDYFILTRERVLMQRMAIGFYDSRQETPMTAILSTGMDATFFGRLFGFGAVTARAYTGNLRLGQLPDPDLIFSYLEYRRKSLQLEQKRDEQSKMHALLQNRLQPEQARTTQPIPVQSDETVKVNYYTGSLSDVLARFFGLRFEKEGAIVYRTHWWILVKKTIVPFFLLALTFGAAVGRFVGLYDLNETTVYLGAIVFTVIGWFSWFYEYIDWRNDIYIITSDQLVDINRRPLGSEEKRSAPVKNIQTVEYKRNGIIALTLNFGTVRIQIGNEELTFDNVYNPSAVQIEIFNHMQKFNELAKHNEQKRMVDWISTYDGIRRLQAQETNEDTKPEKE